MDFVKSLFTQENALTLGVGLIFIGAILFSTPRIYKSQFAAYDQLRQVLKEEAQQLGQSERLKKLIEHEKAVSTMPLYGKWLVIAGLCVILMIVVWRAMK